MGSRKLTLFEYHSHGRGPTLFPSDLRETLGGITEDEPVDEEPSDASSSGKRGVAMAVLTFALVAGLALVWKRRGMDDTGAEPSTLEVAEYEE